MSRHGKILDTNTRYSLTIDREFKAQLQEIANKERRSLNNLIIVALEKYIKEYEADQE
nr:MAG TPA: hypothetical protein [Caudoviricetes sp.]